MIKKYIIAGMLIVLGIGSIICPGLINYVETDYINLPQLLHDYPDGRFYIGGVLIILGILLFVINPAKGYCMKSNDIITTLPELPIGLSCEKELELKTTNVSVETIKNALDDVQAFARDINNSKVKKPFFFSICDIPFIVKIGYLIGDGTRAIRYLHYVRSKGKCIEIKGNKEDIEFTGNFTSKDSKQLLVTVSSSFLVNHDALNEKFSSMNLLSIKTNKVDVDCITSLNDLNRFCDFVIDAMREKATDVTEVHLILATSSSVALAIGQRISNTMDRPIIVYQFENSNVVDNRPWGICINAKDEGNNTIIVS